MKNPLFIKFVVICVLSLFLIVPISMIHNVVSERAENNASVMQDIAKSASGPQTLLGPLLVIPYKLTKREWQEDPISHMRREYVTITAGKRVFLPEQLSIDANISTQVRSRGIYEARVFNGGIPLKGQFKIPDNFGISESHLDEYAFETPYLLMGISDVRGIEGGLKLDWQGQKVEFEAGTRWAQMGAGVHANLPLDSLKTLKTIDFEFDLKLAGTESLGFLPVGRQTDIRLKSTWPHPSFIGEFLPSERKVSDQGFEAAWQTTFFATNFQELLDRCVDSNDCNEFKSRRFAVDFVDPVNHYLKTDRALKYALLFIALTFASFFMFEILKRQRVHPVQYAFVGLGLAIFYLLLISLSEHLGFFMAYLISAVGCILLIGFYTSHILCNRLGGCLFTAGLSLLYALLYSLLRSEDYALLMGALLLFMLLGAVMVITRKLNWYELAMPTVGAFENRPVDQSV